MSSSLRAVGYMHRPATQVAPACCSFDVLPWSFFLHKALCCLRAVSSKDSAKYGLTFHRRIRRVKCGEEKPHCKRCTTTGRKCDGYTNPAESNHANRSPESLSPALVTDVSSDALERRTFDFFRAKTAPCVAGYFHDSVRHPKQQAGELTLKHARCHITARQS